MRDQMKLIITFCLTLLAALTANAQDKRELIQVTGVVMTADSSSPVAYTSVMIRNLNRGDITTERGVFSIACYKGDTLDFNAMGFKEKSYVVPTDAEGKFISIVQYLPHDTFYLDEVVIKDYLPQNAEEFQYALRYWDLDQDMYYTALNNINPNNLNVLIKSLPKSGAEVQSFNQRAGANSATYSPYQTTGQLGNPLKWAEFIKAVRNGDFKSDPKKKK